MKNTVAGIYYVDWGHCYFCFTNRTKARDFGLERSTPYKLAKTATEIEVLRQVYAAEPGRFDFKDLSAERLIQRTK